MQYLHVRFFLSPELSSSMSDSNSNISTLSTVVHSTRLFDFHCQILDNISLVAELIWWFMVNLSGFLWANYRSKGPQVFNATYLLRTIEFRMDGNLINITFWKFFPPNIYYSIKKINTYVFT